MGDMKGGVKMARILLVDDEEDILELYSEELSDEGHQVVTVNSGDQVKQYLVHSIQPLRILIKKKI